jgi:hypothetical protein
MFVQCIAIVFFGMSLRDPSVAESLAVIRAVGPNGKGSAEAAKAWQAIAGADVGQIPTILAGMDGANPVARNWLRAAIDAVRDTARAKKSSMPAKEIEAFLAEKKHDPQARRLAYEILIEADAGAADRLLPTMLDDPSPDLRYEAVARVFNAAQKLPEDKKDEAVAQFQKALAGARDPDQINKTARRLRELGHPPDLPTLLGLITTWKLIGPFPNVEQKGVNEVYPPETKLDFSAEYDGKDGRVKWLDYVTADPSAIVDLNAGIGKHIDAVGYAAAEFTSDTAQDVQIRLGCFTAFKLWVNGELVLDRGDAYTGMRLDHYVAQARLKSGKNFILLKSCQADPPAPLPKHWRFMLRVCDADGRAVLSTTRPANTPTEKKSSAG